MEDLKKMLDADLVDLGFQLKSKYDLMEVRLDAVKAEVKERAKRAKQDHLYGGSHFVNVSPGSSTSCDPKELYDAYDDLGNELGFFSAVKVLVGQAKKDLGETIFGTISKTNTFPYNTVSFKEKVPKKYLKKENNYPDMPGK